MTFISKQIEDLGERFDRMDKMEGSIDKIDGDIRKLVIPFATLKGSVLKGSVKETEATMQSIAKILVDQGLATID